MLSKEQLEKIANQGPVDIGGAQNPIVTEMATELLSLREQLAELKALPPSFYVLKTAYADAWGDACDLRCYEDETDVSKAKDDFGGVIIPLFTAAKPAEIPRHIYSMLVNELRDVPAIGCKRELIVGVLNRHGVIAEPVGD
ncbi:hypothetical protein [Yersinia frederiksenii]|uniref:hypothetical protein n=1 Tax=Yersinia frederiksenii TaxID=29484 RepID=UPI0020CC276D|nr:hypothetical protein [Yersinia frederiksenii]